MRGQVVGSGLAQGGNAGGRAVMRLPITERLRRRLDDVRRSVEVGLADLEVDDALARGLKGLGAGEDFEGGLGTETLECGCKLGHGAPWGIGTARRGGAGR